VLAGAGLTAFFAAQVAAGLTALALVLALTGHRALPRLRGGLARWRTHAGDLLPLAIAMALAVIYLRAAMVLASVIAPADEAGWFAAAFRIVEVLATIPVLAAGAVLPILARASEQDRRRHAATARRTVGSCALLGLGLAAATALAAPLLVGVIAGPDFDSSVPVLRIAAIALGLACVNAALTITLLSLDLHRHMLVAAAAGLTALVAATLGLTPAAGAEGTALAMVVGEAAWLLAASTATVRSGALTRNRTPVAA
jgi:PST family polysaccharide transporter